jgi:hypothetical protein
MRYALCVLRYPASVKVLLLSTSTTFFTEGDPSQTLLALLERELREKYPGDDWLCEGDLLYVGPTMARRANTCVERRNPDVVIVRPTGQSFIRDEVIYAIRNRWPRLYRPAVRLSEIVRKLGGGRRHGDDGPRGWLFRWPRALSAKIIGVAPEHTVEQAAGYVIETLDSLAQVEDLQFICHATVGQAAPDIPMAEHIRRRDYFIDAVRAHCSARRIPFSSVAEALAAKGIGLDYTNDQWHGGLAYRQTDAEAMASQVAKVAGGCGLETIVRAEAGSP